MKKIILFISFFLCFANANAQPPAKAYSDYGSQHNEMIRESEKSREAKADLTRKPNASSSSSSSGSTTVEKDPEIEKLFGLNKTTQAERDAIYKEEQIRIANDQKKQEEFEQKAETLRWNISNTSNNIIGAVENYFEKTISFINQNNNFTEAKLIKGDRKNGLVTLQGANYTLVANLTNGIKNGGATLIFKNGPIAQINCNFTNNELSEKATVLFANEKYVSHINLNFKNNKIIDKMILVYYGGSYMETTIINNSVNGLVIYKDISGSNSRCIYHFGIFKTLLSAYNPSIKFSYAPEFIVKNENNQEIEWSKEATTTSVQTSQNYGATTIITKTTSYGKSKPSLFVAWSNGRSYYGTFNDNKMSGGTLVGETGWVYQGDFKNGSRTGEGTIYWETGGSYEGEFKNNLKSGKGTETKTNGFYKKGIFKDDEEKSIKYYTGKDIEITKEEFDNY